MAISWISSVFKKKGFRGNFIIFGSFKGIFFGSRVFLAFFGIEAIFNQFIIIIILIISKNVYELII